MLRALAPILHRDEYTRAIEQQLRAYFVETIYAPLVAILEEANVPVRLNAGPEPSALHRAILAGQVWYHEGTFGGRFSAAISQEIRQLGATFNQPSSTFSLPPERLPFGLRAVIAQALQHSQDVHRAIEQTLAAMEENLPSAPTGITAGHEVSDILQDLDAQFTRTVGTVIKEPVILYPTAQIAKDAERAIATNLDRAIKDFAVDQIADLRRKVAVNTWAGHRTDRLAELIEADFGVSKRKAAFLAEQESGLLVAQYRRKRYEGVGSRAYKWSTSRDDIVRADHRALHGTVHLWSSPPVTCRRTGACNHPGEDFRCRCVALPLIEFPE